MYRYILFMMNFGAIVLFKEYTSRIVPDTPWYLDPLASQPTPSPLVSHGKPLPNRRSFPKSTKYKARLITAIAQIAQLRRRQRRLPLILLFPHVLEKLFPRLDRALEEFNMRICQVP